MREVKQTIPSIRDVEQKTPFKNVVAFRLWASQDLARLKRLHDALLTTLSIIDGQIDRARARRTRTRGRVR
jgi:hypothetical protein